MIVLHIPGTIWKKHKPLLPFDKFCVTDTLGSSFIEVPGVVYVTLILSYVFSENLNTGLRRENSVFVKKKKEFKYLKLNMENMYWLVPNQLEGTIWPTFSFKALYNFFLSVWASHSSPFFPSYYPGQIPEEPSSASLASLDTLVVGNTLHKVTLQVSYRPALNSASK